MVQGRVIGVLKGRASGERVSLQVGKGTHWREPAESAICSG